MRTLKRVDLPINLGCSGERHSQEFPGMNQLIIEQPASEKSKHFGLIFERNVE